MKRLLTTIIILFCFNPLFCQKDTSQYYNKTVSNNNFSIELGGKGYLYSLGYERTIYKSKKFLLSGTINLTYEPFVGINGIVVPLGINLLVGEKRNKFLLGLSATSGLDFFNVYPKTRKERLAYRMSGLNYNPLYLLVFAQPSIGYRRYFRKGNSLSITFVPIFPLFIDEIGGGYFDFKDITPWLGVNYNFKL